jgi:hypothetical protein
VIHDLSEHTKRLIDWTAAGMTLLSLSSLSAMLTVIATLLTITWYAIRLHDRIRYGPTGRSQ